MTMEEHEKLIKKARQEAALAAYELGLREGREEVKAALRELLGVDKASAMV